jgi:addiction module HigA family antidote
MSGPRTSRDHCPGRCGCAPRKINEIVNGKRGISASFAITLESALGTTAEMWIRMQADYDLWEARRKFAGAGTGM